MNEELKKAVLSVMEAEDNANEWKSEARNRMRTVSIIVQAMNKINGTEYKPRDLFLQVKEMILAERETPTEAPEASAV